MNKPKEQYLNIQHTYRIGFVKALSFNHGYPNYPRRLYMSKCIWCHGTGLTSIHAHPLIPCLNCHGSGSGKDGGPTIIPGRKPWMVGNQYGEKKTHHSPIQEMPFNDPLCLSTWRNTTGGAEIPICHDDPRNAVKRHEKLTTMPQDQFSTLPCQKIGTYSHGQNRAIFGYIPNHG
jgi:hypothetical protein